MGKSERRFKYIRGRGGEMNAKKKFKSGNVPEMRIIVEHIHVFKDTENRVYMPVLPERTERAEKKTKDKTYRLLRIICTLVFSVCMAISVYLLLAPAAYEQRGYMAYGGECLVAVAAGLFTLIFLKGD